MTDWSLPEHWLDENTRMRRLAANLRLEAAEYGKRRWAALADHSLTPDECHALEVSRWSCITRATAIERTLRDVPGG